MPRAQRRGRVGAQGLGQRRAHPLVGGEGLGRAPGGGERVDQRPGEVLAQRVRGGELLQPRHDLGRPPLAAQLDRLLSLIPVVRCNGFLVRLVRSGHAAIVRVESLVVVVVCLTVGAVVCVPDLPLIVLRERTEVGVVVSADVPIGS